MTPFLLTAELVETLHDAALNPGELPGRARDKSLEGALARVENWLAYGMVNDAFDLAAAYAEAVSQGHCFNDGNKRTAFECMNFCLRMNGIIVAWSPAEIGDQIIALAQRRIAAPDLADWLRARVVTA